MKFNIRYALAFICIFAIEVFIALYVRDDFFRPFVGDVLVVILLYCLIKTFWEKHAAWLPVYIFLFAVAVEIGQLFNIVKILHLEDNVIARTIIGTTYDTSDIICYFVGCILLLLWQGSGKAERK